MTALHIDSRLCDDDRRQAIYRGELFVYSSTESMRELADFTRGFVEAAFGSRNPELAQFDMPVAEYAALLGDLKPKYIHHPECKRLIQRLLTELGCDPQQSYFDVPRLRTSTSNDYLTTGIAYAFHPHRDTWYSAPLCQINWWAPIYPIAPNNAMAFHPQHWSNPLRNSSERYDYQRWNATARFAAAEQIGTDTREQPKALEPVAMEPDVRVIVPVGGVLMFSAAQLHSSIPNTSGRTRFSIDFRTVNRLDAERLIGAHNIDSRCTGTAMPDYIRVSDLQHLPQELIERYLPGHPQQ